MVSLNNKHKCIENIVLTVILDMKKVFFNNGITGSWTSQIFIGNFEL